MKLDLNDWVNNKLIAATNAIPVSTLAEEMERSHEFFSEMQRQVVENEVTLVAGAEASIAQKELIEEQLEIIREQNKLLLDNYEKLKELYDDQVQANKDAKDDLEKSRRFNRWMMVISVIAMLAAVASPIVTLWVS